MNMSAASPAKFVFDLDLGKSREKNRIIGEYALADLLKKAEEKGYARGLAEGEATTIASAAKSLSADAKNLVMQATTLQNGAQEAQNQIMADATGLALTISRKLAGNLIARQPLGEIKTLIAECFASLEAVPHLVIRCHPDLAEAVQKAAEEQARTSGFAGRLVVMGEPEISLGDARLEWVDGGLVRDISRLSKDIDARITAFLEARNPEAISKTPPADQPADIANTVAGELAPRQKL
jgi:flagellar assembly protein FliH